MRSHKTATVLLSLLLATTAHADDEISEIDLCREASLIANQVMTARQKNRPMSETLSKTIGQFKAWSDKYGREMDMEKTEEAAAAMVMNAYREMISPTEVYKQLAITEFENDIFQECYEALNADSDE